MSTGSYDYTKSDIPTANDTDDFEIGGAVAPRSADDIERENTFNDIPPGEHLLVIQGFADKPAPSFTKVDLNGQIAALATHMVRVRFSLPGDPRSTITDFFLLPPSDPSHQRAYFDGIPEGKKAAGWAASKFVHFINRLGFTWEAGQPLPEAARRLGNWKGRTIHATVEPGRGTYVNKKTGVETPNGPQIKLFSYRPANEASMAGARAAASTNGMTSHRPASHANGGGAGMTSSAASATSALDNI